MTPLYGWTTTASNDYSTTSLFYLLILNIKYASNIIQNYIAYQSDISTFLINTKLHHKNVKMLMMVLNLLEGVLRGARIETRTRTASPAAAARAIPSAASRSVRVHVKECVQRRAVDIKALLFWYKSLNMDCSEEVQSLSDETGTPVELKKGMSIFLDVSTDGSMLVYG